MKNSVVKYMKSVIALLCITFIIPSTLTLNNREIATKLQIENNLEEKVINVISKIYDSNKFAVTTNVVLLNTDNSYINNTVTQSFGALELEGILPAVPKKSEDGIVTDNNDYKIQIKDITIWLDYDLDVVNAQQEIKQFLFESMDWLAECENCVKFRSRQFPTSSSTTSTSSGPNPSFDNLATEDDIRILEDNISYIMEQLDKNIEDNTNSKNQWMIDYLERTLQEQKDENSILSTQLMKQTWNIIKRDSSIIMNTTSGQKEIAETAMKENSRIVEKVSDNQFENNRYILIVLFVLIGIVVLLVVLSFLNKGPKTVYLKPKKQNTKQDEAISDNEENTNNVQSERNVIAQPGSGMKLDSTNAYEDDSVLQSDLKTIKQSAVKMSVGQKQGASQIVKDWLDDSAESDQGNEDNDQNDKSEE